MYTHAEVSATYAVFYMHEYVYIFITSHVRQLLVARSAIYIYIYMYAYTCTYRYKNVRT